MAHYCAAQAAPAEPVLGSEVISAAASTAVRDWLETQARVVEYWRDLLANAGAAEDLVAALDAHAAFLNGVTMRS